MKDEREIPARPILARLLARLAARLPSKEIADACVPELGPMLVRYIVLRTPIVNVYLHHFLRSDNDQHMHDHPWNFLSVLLTGGYIEHTPHRTFHRRRFLILYRPASWQHWVEIHRPVWTLVVVSRRVREWGFWTPDGWISWRRYVSSRWCDDGV